MTALRKLYHNTLLVQALILYSGYIALGVAIPKPFVSSGVGILAILAGVMLFGRYFVMAWRILFNGDRSEYGGHYAVLGAAEIGAGIIYSGLYRIFWNFLKEHPELADQYFGGADSWTGTAISSLGLFMIAHGAYLQARSPDTVVKGGRLPPGFINLAIWVLCIVIAFVAGTQINS